MKHLSFTNIIVVLLFITQLYLMWRINKREDYDTRSMEALNGVISSNDSIIKQNELIVAHLDAEIASYTDTLKIYERQRTIINNHYDKDLSYVLSADSGAQFDLYRRNVSRYDSLFSKGFFFTGNRD